MDSSRFCPECGFSYDYRHRHGCSRSGETGPTVNDVVRDIRVQIAELQARLAKAELSQHTQEPKDE